MTKEPIAYLVITPGGSVTLNHDALTEERAQSLLGAGKRTEYWPANMQVVVLANEDGKALGLDPNWKATAVVRSRLRPDGFIAGNAIVTGPPDDSGEATGLTVKDEEAVRRLTERT